MNWLQSNKRRPIENLKNRPISKPKQFAVKYFFLLIKLSETLPSRDWRPLFLLQSISSTFYEQLFHRFPGTKQTQMVNTEKLCKTLVYKKMLIKSWRNWLTLVVNGETLMKATHPMIRLGQFGACTKLV